MYLLTFFMCHVSLYLFMYFLFCYKKTCTCTHNIVHVYNVHESGRTWNKRLIFLQCIYLHVQVHVHVLVHVNKDTYIVHCTCTCTCTLLLTYMYMYMYVQLCTFIFVCGWIYLGPRESSVIRVVPVTS